LVVGGLKNSGQQHRDIVDRNFVSLGQTRQQFMGQKSVWTAKVEDEIDALGHIGPPERRQVVGIAKANGESETSVV
jgi:hypothetical protein